MREPRLWGESWEQCARRLDREVRGEPEPPWQPMGDEDRAAWVRVCVAVMDKPAEVPTPPPVWAQTL